MIKFEYNVLGVMSGTSLDGLDIAYIKFNFNNAWSFKIISSETISYSKEWNEILKNLVSNSKEELESIDTKYTAYLGSVIRNFIQRHQITELDAVCSHGHTALHQPKKGITYQIGNKRELAQLIKTTVICDFRVQDVKLGGQGAPLVPIGDELLFSEFNYCLNLGGFANVSTKSNSVRIAYDICPVNIVLNHYASKLGFDYDKSGKIAASGKVNKTLLTQLNSLEYYQLNSPKSLGLEWVRETVLPLIDSFNLSVATILRTFVEHIALQIVKETSQLTKATVFITGGGVYNLFLMERIKNLSKNNICIPSKKIIEYKEALIFGLLGVLKLRNENNCLSSVTGASKNHSSGLIFHA